MAENTLQQENKSFRTEEIGGHQIQPVKMMLGADNVDDGNVSVTNPLPTVKESVAITRGLVPGKSHAHIFGSNLDIDTAAAENIWAAGGLFTFPPAAETFAIVSDDPVDNGVTPNTGARTVLITGLDATGLETTETITLNGTTPVNTASMTHIQKIEVITAGSTNANQGSISATGNTSALVVANFAPEKNSSSLGHYKVPTGKTGYIEKLVLTAAKNAGAGALVTIQRRLTGSVFRTIGEIGASQSGLVYEFTTPPELAAGTELKFLADVLTNNTQVSVFMEILLIDD